MIAGNTVSHAASNHKDTSFSFVFEKPGASAYTPARQKLNLTSAYMKATYISNGGAITARVTLEDGTVVGPSYTIVENKSKYLVNYAGEIYGLPVYVKIKATSPYGALIYGASGVWSPDSI